MNEALIERTARALSELAGCNPDALHEHHEWENFIRMNLLP